MKAKHTISTLAAAAFLMEALPGFAAAYPVHSPIPEVAVEAAQAHEAAQKKMEEEKQQRKAQDEARKAYEAQRQSGGGDAAVESIMQKAAQEEQQAADALKEAQQTAAAIEYKGLVGAWQLVRLGDQDVSFLYVDGTLIFEPKETVDLRQFLKNRDRTDAFTAKVAVKRDASGVLSFAPDAETVAVRSYEDRPVAKSDLEDQLWPWMFRYDDADAAGSSETHARTIERSYQVTKLVGDTLTVVETYSDSDGCAKRRLVLTYTRGLHQVTDADRTAETQAQAELAAQQAARRTKHSAAEINAIKARVSGTPAAKKETKAEKKLRKQQEAQAKRAAEEAAQRQAAAEAAAQEYAAIPDLRIGD